MGLHYSEKEFFERVRQLERLYRKAKINKREAANAFFDAAYGQKRSALEKAFLGIPNEFHPLLAEFLTEQEEIGYESKGQMIRIMFRDDKAEMEARLARHRPIIKKTCGELRRLLNESSEQGGDAKRD